MTVKAENTSVQELENIEWTIGWEPEKRGKYQITIETIGNGKPELKVKIDSWDLKVWRNFQKHVTAKKAIIAFRCYDPQPFKSQAYIDAEVKEISDKIKILENVVIGLRGEAK